MKVCIRSMSMSKKDIGAKIEDGTQTIIIHLIKLWLYPHSESKHHWRKEIASALFNVPTMKGRSKHPSSKFILDNTWNIHSNLYESYLDYVLVDYGDSDADTSKLRDHIEMYFRWLADELSANLIVPHKRIYSELEKLGF